MPRPLINLSDRRSGSLVAVRRVGSYGLNNEAVWECRCDCGRMIRVPSQAFRRGHRTSCPVCASPRAEPAGGIPYPADIEEARLMMCTGRSEADIREWFGWTVEQLRYAAEAVEAETAA